MKSAQLYSNSWNLRYAHWDDLSSQSAGLSDDFLREKPRLLLVDDQPSNIQVLHEIFRPDHEIFMATSGHKALEICRQHQPDLILLDVVMPRMDGYELCQILKNDPELKAIPIIFVTSQDSSFDETQGFDCGAVDFIAKPVQPAVVRARVKTHLTLKAQADLLRSLAYIDSLTGIPNRRQFEKEIARSWNAAQRQQLPISLIFLDVDHFKQFNDHYGHDQGDECLQTIAQTLSAQINRGHDLVARFGGEEFVALLPNTRMDGAVEVAERLRQAIEKLAIPHENGVASKVSISLGVSTVIPSAAFDSRDLIQMADHQLYQAKSEGRNCTRAQALTLTSKSAVL